MSTSTIPSSKSTRSSGSGKSSSNMPPRPRSPVSMYQMDFGFGAPKPPRPLVRPEPKVPKSGRNSTLDKHGPSHSPSFSIGSSFASSSSSVGTNSTQGSASTQSRPSSRSFFRLFNKPRKANTAPPTIFEPHGSQITPPIGSPTHKPRSDSVVVIRQDQQPNIDRPSSSLVETTRDDEILEVLREPHPGYSRRASLTSSLIHELREQDEQSERPHGSGLPHSPPRPNRHPKRPRTAPSSLPNKRPLPQIPRTETPSTLSVASSSPVPSPDLDKAVPMLPQTQQIDTRRVESSLTRSKSISHSMMMVGPRPDSPFVDISRPMQSYFANALGTNHSSSSTAGRPSQGWSGQWNIEDMCIRVPRSIQCIYLCMLHAKDRIFQR
ncbi:hypothetical protein F5880DRAFT_1289347 [Lentinula raphanica]|nr:hypothetical protein F5880DRAFT_1289347 [Lentinula raphanica]